MPANNVEERNKKIAAKITAMRQFYAIQLTYQYAGMVQGGSGGRAISNEDFQNLYRALWGGSGELAKPRIDAARAIVNKVYTRAKILIANTSNTDNHIVYMAGKTSEITNALFDKNIDGLLNTIVNAPSPVRQRRGPQVNAQGVKAALAKRLQPYATAAQVDLQTPNVMQVLANKQIPAPLSDELKANLIKRSGLELPFDTFGEIVIANVAASLKKNNMMFTQNEIQSFGVSSGNARNFASLSGYRMFIDSLTKAGKDEITKKDNDFKLFVNGVIKTMLSPAQKQPISPTNNEE